MSHNNGKIAAPVSMPADVAAILNIPGTDLASVCTSQNINMWAKYKPVKYAEIGILTDAQRAYANYGIINIPSWGLVQHGTVVAMMNFWLQSYKIEDNAPDCGLVTDYWGYQRPTGGAQSPYRLTDFVKSTTLGYYHEAEPQIAPIENPTLEISPAGQLSIDYKNGAQSDMTLKYSDLRLATGSQMSLAGYYFGVALIRKADVSQSSATRYVKTEMTATDAVELGSYVRTTFEDSSHIASFMGNADSTQFYIMCFFANDEMYDTYTKTSGGTTTTYRKFLTSFNGVTADKFVALLERQEVTIVRKYVDIKVTYLACSRRYQHTNIIDSSYNVHNFMTDYDVTVTKMTLEYLDINGVVIYTQDLINSILVRSGEDYSDTASHNFGSAGTENIDSVRMTIVTIQDALSFRSSDSVKVAYVTTPGPTPTPNA